MTTATQTASTVSAFIHSADAIAYGSFRVQVLGVDEDGCGPYFTTYDQAVEYATGANGNGWSCVIHLLAF